MIVYLGNDAYNDSLDNWAKMYGKHRLTRTKQTEVNATAAQELKNTFIKAFSVCVERKGYTVK